MTNEEIVDAYLKQREEDAWNRVKDKMTTPRMTLELHDIIKNAFIIGYGLGSIDEEKIIKELAKLDPVKFWEWMKEGDSNS